MGQRRIIIDGIDTKTIGISNGVKTTFLLLCFVLVANIYSQDILWMKRFDLSQNEYGRGITSDLSENIIIAGSYENVQGTSSEILVVKYNEFGDTLWYRRYNPSQFNIALDLTTDHMSNIIVMCYHEGISIGNPGIIKFSPNGETIWTRIYPALQNIWLCGIALDSFNNIFTCGIGNEADSEFSVISKFDSSGNLAWTRRFYNWSNGVPRFSNIIVDISQNIFITGELSYWPDTSYLLVAKFNNNGDSIWTRCFATNLPFTYGVDITQDNSRNIIVTGSNVNWQNSGDGLVIKYSVTGNILWYRVFDFRARDFATSTIADAQNYIFVCGGCENQTWNSDYFLVKYSPTGDTLWTRFYNGLYDEYAVGVVTDNQNNPIITGYSSNGSNYDVLTIKYRGSSGIEMPQNYIIQKEDIVRQFSSIIRNHELRFSIIKACNYTITLYDKQGRKVKAISNRFLKEGNHTFNIGALSSGIYFLDIKSNKYRQTQKIIISK